ACPWHLAQAPAQSCAGHWVLRSSGACYSARCSHCTRPRWSTCISTACNTGVRGSARAAHGECCERYSARSVSAVVVQKTFGFPEARDTITLTKSQTLYTAGLRHRHANRISCDDYEATPLAERKTKDERSCASRTASGERFSSVTCRASA